MRNMFLPENMMNKMFSSQLLPNLNGLKYLCDVNRVTQHVGDYKIVNKKQEYFSWHQTVWKTRYRGYKEHTLCSALSITNSMAVLAASLLVMFLVTFQEKGYLWVDKKQIPTTNYTLFPHIFINLNLEIHEMFKHNLYKRKVGAKWSHMGILGWNGRKLSCFS